MSRVSSLKIIASNPITYIAAVAVVIVVAGVSRASISLTSIGAILSILSLIFDKVSGGRRAKEVFLAIT